MMTKKDFELIARVLKDAKGMLYRDHHQALCEDFANALVTTNSGFARFKFLKGCGAEA
jgi:predicted nucleic acid-binding protein